MDVNGLDWFLFYFLHVSKYDEGCLFLCENCDLCDLGYCVCAYVCVSPLSNSDRVHSICDRLSTVYTLHLHTCWRYAHIVLDLIFIWRRRRWERRKKRRFCYLCVWWIHSMRQVCMTQICLLYLYSFGYFWSHSHWTLNSYNTYTYNTHTLSILFHIKIRAYFLSFFVFA